MKIINKIILIKASLVGLIICGMLLMSNLLPSHHIESTTDNKSVMFIDEKYCTEEELFSMSDIIIKGTITEKAKEFIYESENVYGPVSIYKVKLSDTYKMGEDSLKKSVFVKFGGTELPYGLEYNKEYVLYLGKSDVKEKDKDVYGFVSLNQGVLETDGITATNQIGETMTISDIKEKIKIYNKKDN